MKNGDETFRILNDNKRLIFILSCIQVKGYIG